MLLDRCFKLTKHGGYGVKHVCKKKNINVYCIYSIGKVNQHGKEIFGVPKGVSLCLTRWTRWKCLVTFLKLHCRLSMQTHWALTLHHDCRCPAMSQRSVSPLDVSSEQLKVNGSKVRSWTTQRSNLRVSGLKNHLPKKHPSPFRLLLGREKSLEYIGDFKRVFDGAYIFSCFKVVFAMFGSGFKNEKPNKNSTGHGLGVINFLNLT